MTSRVTFRHLLLSTLLLTPSFGQASQPAHPCAALVNSEKLAPEIMSTVKRAQRILDLQSQPVTEVRITSSTDRQDIIFVHGVPEKIQLISHPKERVFRHYSKDSVPLIVESRTLKVGPRPYIDPEAHERREYQDLSGIMFTDPEFEPERLWMGVNRNTDWVEFTLDYDFPIFKCAEGNYLIPAQKDYPEWIRNRYLEYKKTGNADPSLRSQFEKLDEEGGLVDATRIPIRITRYQRQGRIYEVTAP